MSQEKMTAAELRAELGLPPADVAPVPGSNQDQIQAPQSSRADAAKRSKWGNKPTWYNSLVVGLRRYDSKKEAGRARELDLLVASDRVVAWWAQWPQWCGFDDEKGTPVRMYIDFRILWKDETVTYEDVKGAKPTADWLLKAKAVRDHFDIEIKIV